MPFHLFFLSFCILGGLHKFISMSLNWLSISSAFFLSLTYFIWFPSLIHFSFYFGLYPPLPHSITFSFQSVFFSGCSVSLHRGHHLFVLNQGYQTVSWNFPLDPSLNNFLRYALIFLMVFLFPCPIVCFHIAFTECFSLSFKQSKICFSWLCDMDFIWSYFHPFVF